MTPLRQRMLGAMTVRGLAERTQECYAEAVSRMARHYHRSPDLLSPGEVQAYLLHLVKDRKLSYSSVNHAASASRFLFETVLGRKTDEHCAHPWPKCPRSNPSCSPAKRLRACLRVTAVLAGLGRLPSPARSLLPECRGPP